MTSLHPVRPVDPALWSNDPNTISSAMLVEWHDLRLLLGADVPSSEWPGIAEAFPDLNHHAAMKVPHHGSREAIHPSFANGDPERFWVITPFYPKGFLAMRTPLPVAEKEGLSQVLSFVDRVRLTALPYRHVSEADAPVVTTRESLRMETHPRRAQETTVSLLSSDAAFERQVVIGFDRNGSVIQVWYGPGSVRVTSEVSNAP